LKYTNTLYGYKNFSYGTPDYSHKEIVECGPTIKGNFRSPNNWWYKITRIKRDPSVGTKVAGVRGSDGWDDVAQQPRWVFGYEQWLQNGYSSGNHKDFTQESNILQAAADQRAFDKLCEHIRGSVDLSIDAFEIKKTLEMVNLSGRIRQAIFNVSPTRLRRAMQFDIRTPLKGMGKYWLEWQYGWRPLISTLHGVVDELTRYELNKVQTFTGRHSLSLQRKVPTSFNGLNGQFNATQLINLTERCRYSVRLRVDPSLGYDTLRRLSALNPLSIGWELLPYSFVVDWFIDVGGYLRNLETAVLYNRNYVDGYKSTLSVTKSEVTGYASGHINAWTTYSDNCPSHKIDLLAFQRNVLTHMPYPKLPVVYPDLGAERLMSFAGLLSTFLRRKEPVFPGWVTHGRPRTGSTHIDWY